MCNGTPKAFSFSYFSRREFPEYYRDPIAKSPAVDDRLQGDTNGIVVKQTVSFVDATRYEGSVAKEVF